jgi:DNA-binding LacI/PurR family transcriptional regulator
MLLEQMVAGRDVPKRVILPPELIVRGSTDPKRL